MKKLYIVLGTLAILFVVGSYFYNKYYHQKVKSSPKKYCYQTFLGPANSALIIEDIVYKDSLVKYYVEMESGKNPIFNFPLKTLPQYDPVYVVDYTPDSMLVQVISYYDRGKVGGGSFLKGYVYYKTLHDNPPIKK